jgi:hypothetical protein
LKIAYLASVIVKPILKFNVEDIENTMNVFTLKHQSQRALCSGRVLCVMPVKCDLRQVVASVFTLKMFTLKVFTLKVFTLKVFTLKVFTLKNFTQIIFAQAFATQAREERAIRGSFYDPGKSVG